MARPLRVQFAGGLYHVTARGNGQQLIFADDADHERFLDVLACVVARYRVLCHAYCLMGNHYHVLMETPEANLCCAMRQLNGVYSQRFNHRHGRTGHVLQGRFHAQVVDRDGYLRAVCRYIVLNPVRAGLVAHPGEWRWSSYRATAGEGPVPGYLTVDRVLALGEAPARAVAERRYRLFVEAGLTEITAAADTSPAPGFVPGAPLVGDAASLAHLREGVARVATLKEIPRAQRFALRPSLETIFAGIGSRGDRDARCARAFHDHGYTMKAIADFVGVHYCTVSRALSRVGGQGAAAASVWGPAPGVAPGVLECKT